MIEEKPNVINDTISSLGELKFTDRPGILLRIVLVAAALLLSPFGIGALVLVVNDPASNWFGTLPFLLWLGLCYVTLVFNRRGLQVFVSGVVVQSPFGKRVVHFEKVESAEVKHRIFKKHGGSEAGSSAEISRFSYILEISFSDPIRKPIRYELIDRKPLDRVVDAFREYQLR